MSTPSISSQIAALWARTYSPQSQAFPITVSTLLSLGATRYHVDFIHSKVTTYVPRSDESRVDVYVTPIPPHAPSAGATWSKENLIQATRWARGAPEDYHYEGFVKRVLDAGVVDYSTYLEGKRVVYASQLGDLHAEWFPGAGPEGDK